jgi:hypothetical protein
MERKCAQQAVGSASPTLNRGGIDGIVRDALGCAPSMVERRKLAPQFHSSAECLGWHAPRWVPSGSVADRARRLV